MRVRVLQFTTPPPLLPIAVYCVMVTVPVARHAAAVAGYCRRGCCCDGDGAEAVYHAAAVVAVLPVIVLL